MATSHCEICGAVSGVHPIFDGTPWLIAHKRGCPWGYAAAYRTALEGIADDARGAKGRARAALSAPDVGSGEGS